MANGFAQAQAFICWLDTFTRSTSFGLGSDYTWETFDTSFGAQEDSTYHINGTKLINSPENLDYDSYSINRTVPDKGTVKFDFTTASAFSDYPYVGIIFGSDYTIGALSLVIARNAGNWFLWGDWNNNSLPDYSVTIDTSKTYTVKMSYDETGNFARKVWETGQSEPDWMVTGTLPDFGLETTAWLDLYFGGDILSVDNLQFCAPEVFGLIRQSFAQAQALIHRYEGYGQSQGQLTNTTPNGLVQAYVLWEPVTSAFEDYYTRTTAFGLGTPVYLWDGSQSSVNHPAATTVRVASNRVVIPPGIVDAYNLNYTFGARNTFSFDAIFDANDEDFSFDFNVLGTNQLTIRLFREGGLTNYYVYKDGSLVTGFGFLPTLGSIYTFEYQWTLTVNTSKFYTNGVFTSSSSGGSGFNISGPLNLNLKFTGPVTENIYFDHLILNSNNYGFGQARAKIVPTRKHGQAKAKIKQTYKSYAQAQAQITVNWRSGQSQARILQVYFGFAQAQAKILAAGTNTLEAVAQAQAQITNTTPTGLALAYIGHYQFGQAQAQITTTWRFGQAQAQITTTWRFGQARAQINITWGIGLAQARIPARISTKGQAQALIFINRWAWAQARAVITTTYVFGQAQAKINTTNKVGNARARILREGTTFGFAQAQATLTSIGLGQAQSTILATVNKCGQSQAYIGVRERFGQAQGFVFGHKLRIGHARAYIGPNYKAFSQALANINGVTTNTGQVQALIKAIAIAKYGQTQARIKRTIGFANAQAYIDQSTTTVGGIPISTTLVRYNGYLLPGYYQEEHLPSEMSIEAHVVKYLDASLSEYTGLENKHISIRMKILDETYAGAKNQVLRAATLLRSNRTQFVPLYLKNPDRYYLAMTEVISTGQNAGTGEKNLDYTATFECRPWLYGGTHILTGTTLLDTDSIGRSFANGTWTPVRLTITGINVTISGYTDSGDFAGFISVSGTVSNLYVDTENYYASENVINNYDYQMFVGPGRTLFEINGATQVTVEYEDRWIL